MRKFIIALTMTLALLITGLTSASGAFEPDAKKVTKHSCSIYTMPWNKMTMHIVKTTNGQNNPKHFKISATYPKQHHSFYIKNRQTGKSWVRTANPTYIKLDPAFQYDIKSQWKEGAAASCYVYRL